MYSVMPLTALRAFEAAARHASFKSAASELAVTPTAISHQIRQLEATLGCRLFIRGTRSVSLTAEGALLARATGEGLRTIADAVAMIDRSTRRRVATLTATVAFTAHWLAPRAAAFRTIAPEWSLRLSASDDVLDLGAGEADAAVRYAAAAAVPESAEPLFTDSFVPVCTPAYRDAVAASAQRWLPIEFRWQSASTANPPRWREWVATHGDPGIDAGAGIFFDDEAHTIAAAMAGQGVALASLLLVEDALTNGALVRPFAGALPGFFHHFVAPPDGGGAATALLRRWLTSLSADHTLKRNSITSPSLTT